MKIHGVPDYAIPADVDPQEVLDDIIEAYHERDEVFLSEICGALEDSSKTTEDYNKLIILVKTMFMAAELYYKGTPAEKAVEKSSEMIKTGDKMEGPLYDWFNEELKRQENRRLMKNLMLALDETDPVN